MVTNPGDECGWEGDRPMASSAGTTPERGRPYQRHGNVVPMISWAPLSIPLQLVVDDVLWRYPSAGVAGEGIAHLRVWTAAPAGHIAIVTEVGLGTSITNSAEHIWAQLVARHLQPLLLLEHYPASEHPQGRDDTLEQVALQGGRPVWRRVWPTTPANPNYAQFKRWMTEYGHRLLST